MCAKFSKHTLPNKRTQLKIASPPTLLSNGAGGPGGRLIFSMLTSIKVTTRPAKTEHTGSRPPCDQTRPPPSEIHRILPCTASPLPPPRFSKAYKPQPTRHTVTQDPPGNRFFPSSNCCIKAGIITGRITARGSDRVTTTRPDPR